MNAYLDKPELKEAFVKEVEKHRKADAIVQGTYGEENGSWRGCAVACSLRSLAILNGEKLHTEYSDHKEYETKLGIPQWLAHLEDALFEGMPTNDAKKWPEQFAKAINVGADLQPVKYKFCAYLMKENIDRVLALEISDELKEQVVSAIRGVLSLHENALETGMWDESAARSAESAAASAERSAASAAWSAESAAASAAWSAASAAWSAESAAASAAWSAAWSAASAASAAWSAERSAAASAERSAAWSAERSAAWSAWSAASAESAAYLKHSKELLKMLKATV
jgi:hypothetical protein